MGFKTASFTSVGNRGLNPTISLARTRRIENPVWNFTLPHTFQGTVAGYTSGGLLGTVYTPQNVIDKFPFASNANATDVGDLSVLNSKTAAGQSSSTDGYVSGGAAGSGGYSYETLIDKFPFASDGNATDVGDLTVGRRNVAGQSSDVDGYTSGGETDVVPGQFNAPRSNVIDKFPFASDGNATDVGDLTVTRTNVVGQSSDVDGYTSGGFVPSFSNVIDKFPFASNANATDIGDLTVARLAAAGQSSTVSGYTSGGQLPSPPVSLFNVIDKFPFATNANATDVGDLTVVRLSVAGQSSNVSGYSSGGYGTPQFEYVNTIDKFPFASDASATDVGDLTVARRQMSGQQD